MAGELASTGIESDVDGPAVSAARGRAVLVLVLSLAAIVMLAAAAWMQVAARFDTARVRTEGETVRNAMTGMLAMGLPLEDFIGFGSVTARIFHANPGILAIAVRDRSGRIALSSPGDSSALAGLPAPIFAAPGDPGSVVVEDLGRRSRLAMPIVNRFGPAGSLELVFERAPLRDLTRNAALAGLAAVALLAVGLTVHGLAIANPEFFQSRRDLLSTYALVSLLGLALASSALAGLAAEKAEETAGAYAHSLGARIGEAAALGISPDQLSGLDEVVQEYRASNSVIGYVALLEGNRIAASTGIGTVGEHWDHPAGYLDAVYEVRPRRLYTPQYRVAVGIDWRVAMRELAASAALPALILLGVLAVGAAAVVRLRVQERG